MMRRMRKTLSWSWIGALLIALVASSSVTAADEVAADEVDVAAEIGAIVERLPESNGGGDAAELSLLAGPPDAFTIAFEPADDGSVSRREQWFYYDLATAFEFADGGLLAQVMGF